MKLKYLFILLIPVFFTVTSCVTQKTKVEDFLTFSSEQNNEPQINNEEQEETEQKAGNKDIAQEEITEETREEPVIESQPKEAEPNIKGEKIIQRYNIGYLTFNVADFYAELKPLRETNDYTEYKFRFYSKTNGFVDYVFGWMSYTASTMKVYKNKVIPQTFRTKVTLKKKTREITMDYDSSGQKIIHEQVTPPDNRGKRPEVKDSLTVGTYDPLSIVIEARRIVMSAFKGNKFNSKGIYNFTLPLYDGRKRTDVNFELRKEAINGLYFLKFTQKPVAGYTNNELEDIKKGERIINIYIDPKTFTPVSAFGKSPLGKATAKLLENCTANSLEECIRATAKKAVKKK